MDLAALCFSKPVTFVTSIWGVLGMWWALCFSKPVTFVTSFWGLLGGCRGLLGPGSRLFLKTRHFCHFHLGAAGGLGTWRALCFSKPVTFITSIWGLLRGSGGCWGPGEPFVSQSPSLLSLPFGSGAAGELGPCFSEPVTFVTWIFVNLGFVANRAPLHAPREEVTKVTTFLKQGCCRKARIEK